MNGVRTDAERFVARKAQALGNDAGPCHHDGRTVDDGKLVPERILVQKLVKVEAAATAPKRAGVFLRAAIWAGQQILVLEWWPRAALATSALLSRRR